MLFRSLLQLLFRLSYPSNLGVGVHDRRDGVVVDVSVTGLDVLHGSDALFFGLVGEHGSKGDIADTLDSGDGSVELVINHDSAPVVDFQSNVFETKTLGVWSATNGDEDNIRLQGLLLAIFGGLGLDKDLAVSFVSSSDLGVELEFDALLGEGLLERLATKSISVVTDKES